MVGQTQGSPPRYGDWADPNHALDINHASRNGDAPVRDERNDPATARGGRCRRVLRIIQEEAAMKTSYVNNMFGMGTEMSPPIVGPTPPMPAPSVNGRTGLVLLAGAALVAYFLLRKRS
jgi:hypothetical protein